MKLIACHGLPAAGKSTWCTCYCADHPGFVVVSKDQIRSELRAEGWQWSQAAEKRDVVPKRNARILAAFAQGQSVLSDDTNLTESHMNGLAMLASLGGASFEIQYFDADVEECVRRDAQRPEGQHVGERRIRQMDAWHGHHVTEKFLGS